MVIKFIRVELNKRSQHITSHHITSEYWLRKILMRRWCELNELRLIVSLGKYNAVCCHSHWQLVYVSISNECDLACSDVTVVPVETKTVWCCSVDQKYIFGLKTSHIVHCHLQQCIVHLCGHRRSWVTNLSLQQIFHANFSCLSDKTLFWEYTGYSLNETKVPIWIFISKMKLM